MKREAHKGKRGSNQTVTYKEQKTAYKTVRQQKAVVKNKFNHASKISQNESVLSRSQSKFIGSNRKAEKSNNLNSKRIRRERYIKEVADITNSTEAILQDNSNNNIANDTTSISSNSRYSSSKRKKIKTKQKVAAYSSKILSEETTATSKTMPTRGIIKEPENSSVLAQKKLKIVRSPRLNENIIKETKPYKSSRRGSITRSTQNAAEKGVKNVVAVTAQRHKLRMKYIRAEIKNLSSSENETLKTTIRTEPPKKYNSLFAKKYASVTPAYLRRGERATKRQSILNLSEETNAISKTTPAREIIKEKEPYKSSRRGSITRSIQNPAVKEVKNTVVITTPRRKLRMKYIRSEMKNLSSSENETLKTTIRTEPPKKHNSLFEDKYASVTPVYLRRGERATKRQGILKNYIFQDEQEPNNSDHEKRSVIKFADRRDYLNKINKPIGKPILGKNKITALGRVRLLRRNFHVSFTNKADSGITKVGYSGTLQQNKIRIGFNKKANSNKKDEVEIRKISLSSHPDYISSTDSNETIINFTEDLYKGNHIRYAEENHEAYYPKYEYEPSLSNNEQSEKEPISTILKDTSEKITTLEVQPNNLPENEQPERKRNTNNTEKQDDKKSDKKKNKAPEDDLRGLSRQNNNKSKELYKEKRDKISEKIISKASDRVIRQIISDNPNEGLIAADRLYKGVRNTRRYYRSAKTIARNTIKATHLTYKAARIIISIASKILAVVTAKVSLIGVAILILALFVFSIFASTTGGMGALFYTVPVTEDVEGTVLKDIDEKIEKLDDELNERIADLKDISGEKYERVEFNVKGDETSAHTDEREFISILTVLLKQDYEKLADSDINSLHKNFYDLYTRDSTYHCEPGCKTRSYTETYTDSEGVTHTRTRRERYCDVDHLQLNIYFEKYSFEKVTDLCEFTSDDDSWANSVFNSDWTILYEDLAFGKADNGQNYLTAEEIEELLENAPTASGTRGELLETAYTLLEYGSTTYQWGAKAEAGGIPSELDCSGFVDWAYKTAGIGNMLSGGGTSYQWSASYAIEESELMPGDLVFKQPPHMTTDSNANHVGIYIGKDESGNNLYIHCSSGSNGVVINSWSGFEYFRRVPVNFE